MCLEPGGGGGGVSLRRYCKVARTTGCWPGWWDGRLRNESYHAAVARPGWYRYISTHSHTLFFSSMSWSVIACFQPRPTTTTHCHSRNYWTQLWIHFKSKVKLSIFIYKIKVYVCPRCYFCPILNLVEFSPQTLSPVHKLICSWFLVERRKRKDNPE